MLVRSPLPPELPCPLGLVMPLWVQSPQCCRGHIILNISSSSGQKRPNQLTEHPFKPFMFYYGFHHEISFFVQIQIMPFMAMRLERILQVYAPVTPPSCSDHEQVCTQSRNDIYVDVIVEEELP